MAGLKSRSSTDGKPAPTKRPARTAKARSPYQRAQRDRGADTRAQLIEAALDVFGRLGFEGASTREIAKAAGVNLAAIAYHFGGKEALYLAVAEHVAGSIAARIGATIVAVGAPTSIADAGAARDALGRLIETLIDVMLGAAEAQCWARFIVREQMQPTAAFDVIYRFMNGAAEVATRLVAVALGQAEAAETRLRVIAMFGQVLIFRVAHALVLRSMQWREIGDTERAMIRRIVLDQIDAILTTGRSPGEGK